MLTLLDSGRTMEDIDWPEFSLTLDSASLLGVIVTFVLGVIIALSFTWVTAKPLVREPHEQHRKPTTWRIQGIPNNVVEEDLRKKLEQSFRTTPEHAKGQEPSILKLSLAKSSSAYTCATVTSASPPPDSYDYGYGTVDREFLGITPLFQPDFTTTNIVE